VNTSTFAKLKDLEEINKASTSRTNHNIPPVSTKNIQVHSSKNSSVRQARADSRKVESRMYAADDEKNEEEPIPFTKEDLNKQDRLRK